MRDWIYGFFMAWGMFLAIPCPKKIWSETARRKMLACLPFVGIVVGAVWALCAWLAGYLPRALGAALGAAAPWLVTGFLHLDGFMDVCDGILSRRDLETRRRILKDSHCGAFAVICMVLLAMAQWSAFLSMENVPLLPLALIPVASRAAAAVGYGLAVWHGFRQFDGMSGDISGFGLVVAELCGAVVLAIGG